MSGTTPQNGAGFAAAVVCWQRRHGRHDLPWQRDASPYAVWLSEIMLQQTQVAAVIPYYRRFVRRFPTVRALAKARQESVLAVWSGLGYYARARNLHAAAKMITTNGIPTTQEGWQKLPGVGKSTAAAVMVFVRGERCAVLDGNVKRVLARTHAVAAAPGTPAGDKILWEAAESLLPSKRTIAPYTQGMMDLGALVCRRARPLCEACPLTAHCRAYQQNAVGEYPKKRKKPNKPEKRAAFLLLYDGGGRVFLQKRPPRGIWGGMWALPQAATKAALWREWQTDEDLRPAKVLRFAHEFTHYRLRAVVYCCAAAATTATAGKWTKNFNRLALPAPLQKLLRGFCGDVR